jgi:GR25 family glycosyltransferase involved in LPS biosynthesis
MRINQTKIKEKKNEKTSIGDVFDKIYVIALPKRKDYILRSLSTFGITPEIMDPIFKGNLDGSSLIKNKIVKKSYNYKNMGKVACHMSHLKVMEKLLSTDAETALIFEDDVKECSGKLFYDKRILSLKKELEKIKDEKWDVLYLGHYSSECSEMNFITEQVCKGGNSLCRHAYAVNRRGAEKILKETLPMYKNGDCMMCDMDVDGRLKSFKVMPPIFYQKSMNLESIFYQNNGGLKSNTGSPVVHDVCNYYPYNYSLWDIDDASLSVVIPSYARPGNVRKLISKLITYNNIGEIIVAHNKKETYEKFDNATNLTYFDDPHGATIRFFAAKEATNDCVLFVDDDHVPSMSLIQSMLKEYRKNPIGIYGPNCRKCSENGYFTNLLVEKNIVLTSILMTDKSVVLNFLDKFDQYSDFLKKTRGNGEDILFNHNFVKEYRVDPKCVKGDYKNLDQVTGAYHKKKDHYETRDELCRRINS